MNRRAMILTGVSSVAASSVLLTMSAAFADIATSSIGTSPPADPGPSPAPDGAATGSADRLSPGDGGSGDKVKPPRSLVCPHCGQVIPAVTDNPGTCRAHSCHG